MHKLQELIETVYGVECRSYSGRGMFGRECLAVVNENNEINPFSFGYEIRELSDDYDIEIAKILDNTKTDSFGLSMIYYWPSVPYTSHDK